MNFIEIIIGLCVLAFIIPFAWKKYNLYHLTRMNNAHKNDIPRIMTGIYAARSALHQYVSDWDGKNKRHEFRLWGSEKVTSEVLFDYLFYNLGYPKIYFLKIDSKGVMSFKIWGVENTTFIFHPQDDGLPHDWKSIYDAVLKYKAGVLPRLAGFPDVEDIVAKARGKYIPHRSKEELRSKYGYSFSDTRDTW